MLKICSNCGDKLLEAATKCPHCGKKDNGFPLLDKNNKEKIGNFIKTVPNPKSGKGKGMLNVEFKQEKIGSAPKNSKPKTETKNDPKTRRFMMAIDKIKFCSYCGKQNRDTATFCGYCGNSFSNKTVDTTLQYQMADIQLKKQQLELEKQKMAQTARCPKCGSTSLSANKKGFGIGKGAAGAVIGSSLLGPIGLIGAAAGNINAKKVHVTCLNCGKRFKL